MRKYKGALYDKRLKKWIAFTNHTGDAPLFYYTSGGIFAFGSQVQYLLDLCREKKYALTFDSESESENA